MTATRQDKAEWMAAHQLWEAKRSIEEANVRLLNAISSLNRAGQAERGWSCLKMTGTLGAESDAIDNLLIQLNKEGQA